MTIYRSIFKELFINLLFVVFSLSVLLFIKKFVMITRLFMGKGAEFIDVARIFIYIQPSLLLLSLPMAILISVFLTYGRMSTDSEIIVMKASGMSFWGISKASVAVSVICFITLLFTSIYLLPRSMYSLKHIIHKTIINKASLTFEEGAFSDVFKGITIFVKEIQSKNRFKGIFIYKDADKSLDRPIVIVAETGNVSSDPEKGLIKLSMNNGFIHTFKENKSTEATFETYDFVLTSGVESITKIRPEEIKTSALWKDRKRRIDWEVEFHRRLAIPLTCIIFGILGPALSNKVGKIGRMGGFSISLSILMLYYLLLIFTEGLAKAGKIPAFLGGWSPDILFTALTAFIVYFAHLDRPLRRL